jgi:prepilin-type N-terminal cleavage/methylation domain-containing protein
MAEDMMTVPNRTPFRARQSGFSMVEMLMTAFILAIGLLGLCMLQTMSLRASRGSRSLTTAVQVAGAVLDQVEMEGRLSWLNLTNSAYSGSTLANLPNIKYINLNTGASRADVFNAQGNAPNTTPDPTANTTMFNVTTTHIDDVNDNGVVGKVSDYSVLVVFNDTVSGTGTLVQRQVLMTRRILHG